ncbi:MAG: TIR domain-containing protein [Acidobacteriota bacterium]|jgi:tetratricopeptide (TPR) repeat protein
MESFRVFLSHSTKDGEFVKKLAAEFERELITPWLCEVDIIAGDNFVTEIEEGLSSSDLAIVAWSPDAASSRWTDLEWATILDREISESRRRLGVVLLKDAKLPELLRTKIFIDARADSDKGVHETVRWVKRMRDMRKDAGAKAANFFLDYEPKDFVGRAEHLEILYAALAEQPGTHLLHGEAGCGKSTLALKFGWRFQGAFDAVIFQACGQRTANEIGMELAARLKIEVGSLPPEQQIEAAKQWLRERRSLLVLDDIWNQDAIELKPGPPASVLCTSRQRLLPWIPAANTREVRSFSQEEAETVFRIYLGDESASRYRAVLLELAERFERLPIAVVVAADVLRRELDPVAQAAHGLRIERLRDTAHDVPGLFQRAIEAQTSRERKLLQAAAVCSPNGFWLPLAGAIAGLDEKESREARDRLVNSSLLRVLDRERQRFQLHALLREQLWKAREVTGLQDKRAAELEKLFKDWEKRWKECRECLPEIIPAMEYMWKAGQTSRSECLGTWGASAARRIGELETSLAILKREEDFWTGRKDAEAKHALEMSCGNQALILRSWGRLNEAMALLKKQETLSLELNNKDGLLVCYGNQARILKDWGRLQNAMELFKTTEALALELGSKARLAATYGNQSLILSEWGRLDEAMELLKKQEALCLELGDKNGLQAVYGNQAVILQTRGQVDEAMELHRKEEALCLELGNKDGLQVCYGNQAVILRSLDRLEEAMELLKKEEALCLELGNKNGLQAGYGNQALILSAWGRLDEALQLFKKEEAICLSLGDKNGLSSSYGNQAVILRDRAQFQEAMELHKKQEALCLELGDKKALGCCYLNWGLLAREQKDLTAAGERLQKALEIFTELNMPRECDAVRAELEKSKKPNGKQTSPTRREKRKSSTKR